ncbi:hypothetical protein [Anaerosporobacter sp.]
MYKMINEELRIASCKLGDLTMEQTQSILAQFKGDVLSTLTGFYTRGDDLFVINSENSDYDFYLLTAESYLSANDEERAAIKKKILSQGIKEFLSLLDITVNYRKTLQLKLMTGNMPTEDYINAIPILRDLNIMRNSDFKEMNAFMYGYIMGKRAERARRKKVQA